MLSIIPTVIPSNYIRSVAPPLVLVTCILVRAENIQYGTS